jgi:Holliday junction resolvase RusA-like endonuclease
VDVRHVSHLGECCEAPDVSQLRRTDGGIEMTFVVLGVPAPKGSTVSFMGAHGLVTKSDSKGLAGWTQAVGWAARCAHVPLAPEGVGVRVTAIFQFVRPKSVKSRPHPVVKPDIDKLTRALLDALTHVAYHDDAQVVTLECVKVYGADARTTVQVSPL